MIITDSHLTIAEDAGLTYNEALTIRKNNQESVFDAINAAYKLGYSRAEEKYRRREVSGV